MKALTLNGYDGLASLRFAEVATPEPGPNDVLVKMKAASVNPVDTKIARGYGGRRSGRCRMCWAATAPAPSSRSAAR